MESLGQDVRYACRLIKRSPGFTAVAALAIALGIGPTTTILSVANALLLRTPSGVVEPGTLVAPPWPDELPEIVYIDHYGNAVTGVWAEGLERDAVVEVPGRRCAFRRTFAEAGAGEAFWYQNANGLVEIALNQGSAAQQLGLAVGTQIRLS